MVIYIYNYVLEQSLESIKKSQSGLGIFCKRRQEKTIKGYLFRIEKKFQARFLT